MIFFVIEKFDYYNLRNSAQICRNDRCGMVSFGISINPRHSSHMLSFIHNFQLQYDQARLAFLKLSINKILPLGQE